jgi:hypothetical protein
MVSVPRARMAALAVVLLSLWTVVSDVHSQTWVRSGDIIFDSFGEPLPMPSGTAVPSETTLASAEEHPVYLESDPPSVLPPVSDDAAELGIETSGRSSYSPVALPSNEWHLLPGTLLYHAYLAGEKEPRIGLSVLSDSKGGWLWESALGGRVGILRRGDLGLYPANAWQIDLEGAALARVSPSEPSAPLQATDYRIGIQWTKRTGPIAYKAGY